MGGIIPEIEYFMKEIGFKLILSEEFMTKRPLSFQSWNAIFIGEKI